MKIPRKVKLGGHTLKIKKMRTDDTFIGRLDTRTFEIALNSKYHSSLLEEAIIHELVHAVNLIYGLYLTEQQVAVVAEQIYSGILPALEERCVRKSSKK